MAVLTVPADRKIRLIHIITDLDTGGAEMMLTKILSRTDREKFDIEVISLKPGGALQERIEALGIPVFSLGLLSSRHLPRAVWRLIRLLKSRKPDVVQTWLYHADLLGGLAARLTGCRRVFWNIRTGTMNPNQGEEKLKRVVKFCARLSKFIPYKILTCSQNAGRYHAEIGFDASKIKVIPNGFDVDLFKPDQSARAEIRNELGIDDETVLIGFVNRFHPMKDHEGFVKAAGLLLGEHPDVHFLLCGTGIEWDNAVLSEWIESTGRRENFHLLGRRTDTPKINAALDIATMCSFYGEAFPNVVGEAMACGVPCVVTDCGDAAIIVGETGVIVPIKNPASLFQGWKQLIQMGRRARRDLGESARERVIRNYSIPVIANAYESEYLFSISGSANGASDSLADASPRIPKAEIANLDWKVIKGFEYEWSRFDQSCLSEEEQREIFDAYFSLFPWEKLPPDAIGFDLGCGSGRWAKLVSPRVGRLFCIDPGESALEVARRNLLGFDNCEFFQAGVDSIPLDDESMDFGYSLGVLHHVPDTQAGIAACAKKLKPGAPFLIYLYYAFDNRPVWFRLIWKASDIVRRIVSRCPYPMRLALSQTIAAVIYWPLARFAWLVERIGIRSDAFPLAFYKDKSFYVMRTDAFDRFGTSLEKRFTRQQISAMLEESGFEQVVFRDGMPYWCAMGIKT